MIVPNDEMVVFPYTESLEVIECDYRHKTFQYLWRARTSLSNGLMFGGKTKVQAGLQWYEFGRLTASKLRIPLSIAFCNITTHNHFVLERGKTVLNSHALVIKLHAESTLLEHSQLIGVLNSSVAWFWMKQMCHSKGGGGIGGGIATEAWEQFAELTASPLKKLPLPATYPTELAEVIQELADERMRIAPERLIMQVVPTGERLAAASSRAQEILLRMIALQEELDWRCYRLYGLLDEDLTTSIGTVPPIRLGERAFEIVMAGKMAAGELETTWFERHRSTPISEIPSHWPEDYRKLIESRIQVMESDRNIALIEQPECKRRWNLEPWEEQERRALRTWLLNRMDDGRYWSALELATCARLADRFQSDDEFRQVAELYRGRSDFDWAALVTELVEAEAVPLLAVLRYSDSGLWKHGIWERTWELQRQEDRIDSAVETDAGISERLKAEVARKRKAEVIGEIPPPPRYDSKDFRKSTYWSLRGKLDVPKERFVRFPYCERDVDPTTVIAWAGWDHLELSRAIAAYYECVKNQEGWTTERRIPLLAGIIELLPWLKQWHNDIHPTYHERMGDFFQQFVEDEARAMEMTLDQIRGWTPPVQSRTRGRKKRNT